MIKIDEREFFFLLDNAKKLIDMYKSNDMKKGEYDKLENMISCYEKIRELSFERKILYDNFLKAKKENPEFSDKIYSLYIQKKLELAQVKRELGGI